MAEDEKRTPVFDWETGDFVSINGVVKTVTAKEAVEQIILKAQATARGIYDIYADVDEPEEDHNYGNDSQEILTATGLPKDAIESELERAITEGLIYDPWITAVGGFSFYQKDGKSYVDFNVSTIFDEVSVEGVELDA